MKKNKIFVACDTNNISKVKEIIKKTQSSKLKIEMMELYRKSYPLALGHKAQHLLHIKIKE